jgi:hypothetical protein
MIAAESVPDREELTDIVSSFLIGKVRQEIYEAGLFIRNVSVGAEREDDWGNDKVYMQSITVDTFSEWRREIPINSLVETINFCFKYGILGTSSPSIDTTLIGPEDIQEITI